MKIPFKEIKFDLERKRIVIRMNVEIDLALTPSELEKLEKRLQHSSKYPFKKLKEAFVTRFEDVEVDQETSQQILKLIKDYKHHK